MAKSIVAQCAAVLLAATLASQVVAKDFPVPKSQNEGVLAPLPPCDEDIARSAAEEAGTKSSYPIPRTATAFRFIGTSTGQNEGALVGVAVSARDCRVIDMVPDLKGKRPWCLYIQNRQGGCRLDLAPS